MTVALKPAPTRAAVSLRPATVADASAVAAIYNASLRTRPYQADEAGEAQGAQWLAEQMAQVRDLWTPPHAHYLGPMSVRMAGNLIEAHQREKRHMLMAVNGRETVGWMGSLGLHERPGLSTLFELAYYVAPRWQGRGVGSQMVAHLIDQAPAWQVDRLLAMVWSDNTASLAVLRRAGFESWGALPGAITAFGKRRDMLMLGMVLPNVSTAPASAAPSLTSAD